MKSVLRWPRVVRNRYRVSLSTLILVAVLTALVDGFCVISLQGAVGAVQRQGDPFESWLLLSLLTVPVHLAVVVWAVALSRRQFGHIRRRGVMLGAALALMVVLTTAVGMMELIGSAVYDYQLQSAQISTAQSHQPAVVAPDPRSVEIPVCIECEIRRQTIVTHKRGVAYAGEVILGANTVLVLWSLAMRGGVLWLPVGQRGRRRRPTRAAGKANPVAVAG